MASNNANAIYSHVLTSASYFNYIWQMLLNFSLHDFYDNCWVRILLRCKLAGLGHNVLSAHCSCTFVSVWHVMMINVYTSTPLDGYQ